MKSLFACLISVACVVGAAPARAHFALEFPTARSGEIDKSPCGPSSGGRGSTVTTLRSGEKVTLQWDVSVQHTTPGLWRISIDDAGQGFPDPVGAGDTSQLPLFMDHVEVSGLMKQELAITLPDIECDDCTLQLLQYKYPAPPYTDPSSFYYQCADIVLTSDPSAGGTSSVPTGGGPASAGSSNGGSGSGAKPADAADGGCSVGTRGVSSGAMSSWLALALLVAERRRRRR